MARYRQKDEADLRWNSIRRRITRELDTQIAEIREAILNDLLTDAYNQHAASLERGDEIKLDAGYPEFIAKAIEQAAHPLRQIAAPDAPVE